MLKPYTSKTIFIKRMTSKKNNWNTNQRKVDKKKNHFLENCFKNMESNIDLDYLINIIVLTLI